MARFGCVSFSLVFASYRLPTGRVRVSSVFRFRYGFSFTRRPSFCRSRLVNVRAGFPFSSRSPRPAPLPFIVFAMIFSCVRIRRRRRFPFRQCFSHMCVPDVHIVHRCRGYLRSLPVNRYSYATQSPGQ